MIFVEFCDNSNIHGVRYFTERQLHWTERLWWVTAIAVSLYMCGSLTLNIWDNWNAKPVTLSFTVENEAVMLIPFPQVTICPEVKTRKFDVSIDRTDLTSTKLRTLAHICPRLPEYIELTDNFMNESIYNVIQDMALGRSDYFQKCQDDIYSKSTCEKIVAVLTEVGLCYTYNALNSSQLYTDQMAPGMKIVKINDEMSNPNWHFENLAKYNETATYPRRTYIYGKDHGATFEFKLNIEDILQYKCTGFEQGFKVVLNIPGESVKMSSHFVRVPPSEHTHIIVKPKLTYTSEKLRKYEPNQRQCYYNAERQLRFFKLYSQSSCEDECLANFTKIACACVKFSMPRDSKTRICGGAKIACYKSAKVDMLSYSGQSFRDKCNCLPTCTMIDYNFDIERAKFDSDTFFQIGNATSQLNRLQIGKLWVYYDGEHMETVKRIPTNTFSDFLANCGGFLGVFLGVSALSIVELIYFASLRLYWVNHTAKSSAKLTSIITKLNNLRFVRGTRCFFNELCDNSNIHGVLYFTRRNMHWSERLWWIISVGVSILLCWSFIQNIWQRWNENMVTLSFSKSPVSISTIPLPTITICSEVKSLMQRLNGILLSDFKDIFHKHGFMEHNRLIHISRVLAVLMNSNIGLSKFPRIESTSMFASIQRMAPQLNETLTKCWWDDKLVDCSEYFVPVLTGEGFCFTFNALNSHEIYTDEMAPNMKIVKNLPNVSSWSLENGYENEPNEGDYPKRLVESAGGTALKISFSFDDDDIDPFYKSYGSDFKVFFTTPGDAMTFSKKMYRVPFSKDVRINVNSKMTTTSEGLRSYTPDQRKCYHSSERKLRFFKIYTQSNCEEECLANSMINLGLKCVKFSLPRDNNTAICGLRQTVPVIMVEITFRADWRLIEAHETRPFLKECNCLPTCTTIDYIVDIDKTELNANNQSHDEKNSRRTQEAVLTILFENQQVNIVKRIETYTFTDFLAICGGLLGLFMGISALSIIELIYFCTLRWFWKLRREKADNAVEILGTIDVLPYIDFNH